MRFGGKGLIGLLAVLGVLALPSAAAASSPIAVNSQLDEPLKAAATTCVSEVKEECTLLAAVELANKVSNENSGETVTVEVPEGKYENTLGSAGALRIEDGAGVVINGAGAGKTIIDGGGVDDSVITLGEDASLKLDGVTVQHGREDVGGGISTKGLDELIVENSAIEHNEAEAGGGIYAQWFSYVVLSHSTVEHNTAYAGGGVYGDPYDAIYIVGSMIEENTATDGYGGGVYMLLLSEEAEEYCYGAKAQAHAKAHAKAAITAQEDEFAELNVEQSTIDHNTAAWGGGIYSEQVQDFCPFAKSAPRSGAHASARGPHPALAIPFEQEVSIDQSTIAYNTAAQYTGENERDEGGYGGGIYEGGFFDPIVNSTIAYNFATNDGGGLYVGDETLDFLISDTIFDNTVEPRSEIEAKRRPGAGAAPAGTRAHAAVVEQGGPGNNIATEPDAEVALRNTIVAESGGQENCEGKLYGFAEGGGYNLDYPSSAPEHAPDGCGLEEEHNLRNVNPLLEEELKNNGGPTSTLALTAPSPAIGFVPLKEDCEEPESGFGPAKRNPETGEVEKPVDQRGAPRPGLPGRECDIGAYEYQAPVVTPPPPATPPPPPPVAAVSVLPLKITVSPQCTSKRDITIHIQNVKQFGIVSAVVEIDGHHKKTLTGSHLTTAINLRGLPTGTFTIEIVARTKNGHELTGKRVYHTCHSKLPGHSYLPL